MDLSTSGVVSSPWHADRGFVLASLLRPAARPKAWCYDVGLVVAGSLIIAAAAQIAIPLPLVPLTGQTFAVLLVGALLGARLGACTVLAYLLEGFAGLPVFSEGRSGLAMLAGPTGGYLVGFVAAAASVGWLAQRGWDRRPVTTVAAMTLGNLVLYGFGVAWLAFLMGLDRALAVGVYPFVLGEVVKVGLAAAILPQGWRTLSSLAWTRRRTRRADFGGQSR
jgi:biotin transport system substrate-specific component